MQIHLQINKQTNKQTNKQINKQTVSVVVVDVDVGHIVKVAETFLQFNHLDLALLKVQT